MKEAEVHLHPEEQVGGAEALHGGGWVCVLMCQKDATCSNIGDMQSIPCFRSAMDGLPEVMTDVWYMGKMGQTHVSCYPLPLIVVCAIGHAE